MSSVIGLEMPNAWRTGQVNNPNFDISSDQLNITTNREMWVPSGLIDWASTRHSNAVDPISLQDLATKNYVDINGASLWSTFVAVQDVDMDTNKIINLVDPTLDQDAATKKYVDDNAGATDLDSLTDVTIAAVVDNQFLQYNSSTSQWENVTFVPGTSPAIEAGNSSVTVIDTGTGRIESVVDGTLRLTVGQSLMTLTTPFDMSLQNIRNLATPSLDADAATKKYVDDIIPLIPTDLDDLSDVTILTPLVDQILVNNGSGQWVNQLLTTSQLPSEIAYEDEVNTFTLNNVFQAGLQIAVDVDLDMSGGQIINTKYLDLAQQVTDPLDPTLDRVRIFLDSPPSFGSPDDVLSVLINRDGTIVKKPIPTSETIFALNSFSNGMFTNETGVRISDNDPTIRVQIFNEAAVGDSFDVVLDGSLHTIASPDVSVTTGNTIDLTEGTDITPVKHFVWIELQLGIATLISNTVSFPTSGDFVVIGTFLLQSRLSVIADGAYAVNAPDYEIKDADIRGHLAHINDRLAFLDSSYQNGIVITTAPLVGGGTAAEVTYSTTVGRAFELHLEDIEAFDITTGLALVENEGTQQPDEVTRVNNIGTDLVGLTCANGSTVIATNQTINVVLYTVHNDDEPNQTNYGINVPFDVYTGGGQVTDAIADISGFAIKSIPLRLQGISLLIAEVVISISGAGALFEVIAVKDLRGQIPGAATSGGGGAGGATQLNDLTDVTITTALAQQILENNGAGQWVNVPNPAGLLAVPNIWADYQDFTEITIPADPAATDARFYVKRIDVNNQGLFLKLQQAGAIKEIRLA